jgi:hypothetical protein
MGPDATYWTPRVLESLSVATEIPVGESGDMLPIVRPLRVTVNVEGVGVDAPALTLTTKSCDVRPATLVIVVVRNAGSLA